MILRGVIVGSERERLRGARFAEPASVAPAPASERHIPPAQAREPQPPPAPPLTAESVCEWLEAQTSEVRAVCAHRLASDIESLTERACEAGRESGRAQGRQEALESVRSSLAALSAAVTGGEQTLERESAQLSEACADIVAEVFCKLAGPALVSREAALGTVLEVLKRAKDERSLTIHVSPSDLPYLESQHSAFQEALGSRTWSLCADPRVTLGGCLVESSLGTLDGRLEIQLHELCETLRAAKSAGRGEG